MLRKGLEPSSRMAYAPQAYMYTSSITSAFSLSRAIAVYTFLLLFQERFVSLKHLFILIYLHMLLNQLQQAYLAATKEKKKNEKSALNTLLAQIKNKEIELQRIPNQEEILSLIKKEVKIIWESIGYLELTDKVGELQDEREKKQTLESYLPAMLDREQTQKLIEQTIAELSITDLRTQRGILMKELMGKHKTELDGSLVNEIINMML